MMIQKSNLLSEDDFDSKSKANENLLNRRKFIGGLTTATLAMTIVPRHVLGGTGFIAPSDKINVAYIGYN
jgi:hypothetical protein